MPKQVNLHRLRGSIAWILCLRWRWIHAYFASCLVSNRDKLGHCNWSPAAADWHSIQLYVHHLAPISTQTRSIPSNYNNQTGNKWYWVVDGDDCATIASKHDITQQQFYEWNPATGSTCTTLWSEAYVCVGVSGQHILPNPQTPKGQPDILTNLNPTGSSSSASTTSVSKTTTAPSTTSGGAPGPTGSGTVTDCVTYYEAQSGDSCWSIVNEKYTYLTQALLTKWNPSLGDACSLLKDQYYCVAIKAAQPMPGTIDTCKTWHLVASGDDCWQIEQDNGITAAQFNTWNPQVGSDCAGLWLGYYVCVGV